jgi:hypothetical protein
MRNLLSRLHKVEGTGTPTFEWTGQSGREYSYKVYPLGADFKPVAANYIYARMSEGGHWIPLYVAQTRDLHQRPEGSGKHDGAIQKGATHIHVHASSEGQAVRCEEERDLVLRWRPECNGRLES